MLRSSFRITLIAMSLAVIMAVFSCGNQKNGPSPVKAKEQLSEPEAAALSAEIGNKPLRILVAPRDLPAELGNASAQERFLKSAVRLVSDRLGVKVTLSTSTLPDPAGIFTKFDLVASFLQDSPELRNSARLIPFFPLPGRLPEGPAIAWWAVSPGQPVLARLIAKTLSELREIDSFAADFDAAVGTGSAERYFTSIRYDGVLRAQYFDPTPEAAAWLKARRDAGGKLVAAVRIGGAYGYVPQPDGSVKGLDFDLAVAFAQSIGLALELSVQKEVSAFFTLDGIMPTDLSSGNYSYTPDLLKKVDLYANSFGVNPWRLKLIAMPLIYPIREQLAGRAGEEVHSISQLSGKRFAILKDSIQHTTLKDFAAKNGLSFDFVFRSNEDEGFRFVREGKADYILDGSVVFAINSDKMAGLALSPFFSEIQGVAFGLKKDDLGLNALINGFLDSSRESGLLPGLWTKIFGMDYTAYINAVLAAAE